MVLFQQKGAPFPSQLFYGILVFRKIYYYRKDISFYPGEETGICHLLYLFLQGRVEAGAGSRVEWGREARENVHERGKKDAVAENRTL